jgi:mannose-6-phosphate isomerase
MLEILDDASSTMAGPRRLRADNFTPPSRTPWGGHKIRQRYKAALALEGDGLVGESWEVSVEPSFPSRAADGPETLAELIASHPEAWLGAGDAARFGSTPLLVKLLDAADNLSVQVHPADGDPALGAGESGKPESWIILDAEPGAGLYLGFRDGIDRPDVEGCIASGGALDQLMSFVPVAAGDAFVIAAGTPHAIGAGVTLVEPQYVAPGRRGITYRFWDWNRLYDGAPRELHVARSLEVTSWDEPRGDAFVQRCRAAPTLVGETSVKHECVVDWPWFVVDRISGTGDLDTDACGTMLAVTCVSGSVVIDGARGRLQLRGGESGVVPAVAASLSWTCADALVITTRTR